MQGIGMGPGQADGAALAGQAIGGAAVPMRFETDGNPNTP
jgi:hypothetical protein